MRVVNRKELMRLKDRTIFSKAYGAELIGIYVYEDDIGNDFVYTDLQGFPQEKNSKGFQDNDDFDLILNKKEFEFDLECSTRDGLYDDSQLYAVYDKVDLLKLINKLQEVYIENYTE